MLLLYTIIIASNFISDFYKIRSLHEPVCTAAKRSEAAACVYFLQRLQQSSPQGTRVQCTQCHVNDVHKVITTDTTVVTK